MAIFILVRSACVGTSIRMKRVRDHFKLLNSGLVNCLTLCDLQRKFMKNGVILCAKMIWIYTVFRSGKRIYIFSFFDTKAVQI